MEKQITVSLHDIQSYTYTTKSSSFRNRLRETIQKLKKAKKSISEFTLNTKVGLSLPSEFPSDEAMRLAQLKRQGYRITFVLPDGTIPIYRVKDIR